MIKEHNAISYLVIFLLGGFLAYSACAQTALSQNTLSVDQIQQQWAQIKYNTPESKRSKALEQLSAKVNAEIELSPQQAQLWLWHGIVLSTWAGEKGGLGALGLVKQAREALEKSLSIDAYAMSGSAYTSLGTLYYQVPGWPVSFGSDEKAKHYLERGLSINPDGIDSNYFYGDFLAKQKRYNEARKYLEHALAAAPRPGRPSADVGRRKEIQHLLATLPKPSI